MGDRDRVRSWMRDHDVIHNTVVVPGSDYGVVEPYSEVDADCYLGALIHDRDRASFAVEVDGVHVGNIGLKNHEPRLRRSECFIELGEKRGSGIGTAAMVLFLDWAFAVVPTPAVVARSSWAPQLDVMRLGVFPFNTRAVRLYVGLGFVDEGPIGEHHLDGVVHKVAGMSLSRERWLRRTGTSRT
jgi:RimJ/RimL family protein N-acetyltransferase